MTCERSWQFRCTKKIMKMYMGAVQIEVISQVLTTVPFNEWGNVFVGCSGSFRFDRAVKMKNPTCRAESFAAKRSSRFSMSGRPNILEQIETKIVRVKLASPTRTSRHRDCLKF